MLIFYVKIYVNIKKKIQNIKKKIIWATISVLIEYKSFNIFL